MNRSSQAYLWTAFVIPPLFFFFMFCLSSCHGEKEFIGDFSLILMPATFLVLVVASFRTVSDDNKPPKWKNVLVMILTILSFVSLYLYASCNGSGSFEESRSANAAVLFAILSVLASMLVGFLLLWEMIKTRGVEKENWSAYLFQVISLFTIVGCMFGLLFASYDFATHNKSLAFNSENKPETVYSEDYKYSKEKYEVQVRFRPGRFREFADSVKSGEINQVFYRVHDSFKRGDRDVRILLEGHADSTRLEAGLSSNYELSVLRSIFLHEWLFNGYKDSLRDEIEKRPMKDSWSDYLAKIVFLERAYGTEGLNKKVGVIRILPQAKNKTRELWDYVYFSFYTITTTGYGDIWPRDSYAKLFVVVENLFEVFFLTVLMAAVVGRAVNLGKPSSG